MVTRYKYIYLMIFKYIIKNHMAFVNFNHSANFSTALTNSTTSTNTLYFPSDYPTIIKNGKVFGIKSCTGPLSFNASTGILSHSNSGVSAGNYGPSANVSPSHGGTFTIPYISVNATGHITSASNRTITLPNKISIDNHYLPTQTNTLVSTNTSYAIFGASLIEAIGVDDKGHIINVAGCKLPQITGVGSTDVNVSDDKGTIYIGSNRCITTSSVTPKLNLSPNETVVCTNKVNSIIINNFLVKSNYPIGHYKVVFCTSSSFSTLSFEKLVNITWAIKWANNEIPGETFNILPNKIYEMDFEAVTIANQKIIKGCLTYFG